MTAQGREELAVVGRSPGRETLDLTRELEAAEVALLAVARRQELALEARVALGDLVAVPALRELRAAMARVLVAVPVAPEIH
jgi:hypothetical protein